MSDDGRDGDDGAVEYEVQEGERAEADRFAIFLRMTPLIGPEKANRMYVGLRRVMSALAEFPGPKANAIDDEASELFGIEIRRELYYGLPGTRRLATPYRILYTIIGSQTDHEIGIVRVLRVLHGSQDVNPGVD